MLGLIDAANRQPISQKSSWTFSAAFGRIRSAMPTRRLPNSTITVIRTLTTARDAWKQFPNDRLITAAHWAKLDDANPQSFLSRLLKEAGDVPNALATQAPLTSTLGRAMDRLTLFVSHFHQVYDLGVARGVFTPGGRAHYDRDITATALPDLSSITAVLEAASKIAPGEAARAIAEGTAHIPMALPSAAEVSTAHTDALSIRAAAEAAKLNTDTQQNELAALYPEAQKLAVSLINTIEFNLGERDDLDDAGRRHIARLWGVVYINDDGSAAEEGGPVTPKPAPVPTDVKPA